MLRLLIIVFVSTCAPPPAPSSDSVGTDALKLPYAEAGWTDRETATFLANRMTFGATPALIDEIEQRGPDRWLYDQLHPPRADELERELRRRYPALEMETDKMVREYPAPVLRLVYTLVRANIQKVDYSEVTEDASALNEKLDLLVEDALNVRGEDRPLFDGVPSLQRILDKQDYGDFNRLLYQLMARKLERAVRGENQLQEVLADFWFNHFNVSLTRINETANFIPGYERDAIRAHLDGTFGEMLLATAKHPAMITYLDNGRNNPEADAPTLVPQRDPREQYGDLYETLRDFIDQPGLNENYARELMELHTLGVEGGYTQDDVVALARILTGWKVPVTTQPLPGLIRGIVKLGMRRQEKAVVEDVFYFNPEWHDSGPKRLLGTDYPAGGGYEEGVAAIAQLADHPSTARFVSTKLARRFTTAEPPPALVEAMTRRWEATGGDLRSVFAAMVEHPDFWNKAHIEAKVKPPLHFVVSALRELGGDIDDPAETLRWCTRLGQPLYACQPPTGYPDAAGFWATGSGMLRRMDFAQRLGGGDETITLNLAGPGFQTY